MLPSPLMTGQREGERVNRQRDPRAIKFVRLRELPTASLLSLVNDPGLRRHMPLATGMSEVEVNEWVRTKEQHWDELGFGPWGILVEGRLAGWGGLQPLNEDVEIALVLLPKFWGWGGVVLSLLKRYAFEEVRLPHVLAALPPTRGDARGLLRLGFRLVETMDIEGDRFVVYRLEAPEPRPGSVRSGNIR